MRIVIVGGGMVGLALAHHLRRRGVEPVVLERNPPDSFMARGYMLGFQGFPALEEIGMLAHVRAEGWDIAPRPDGTPVAICVDFVRFMAILARGVPVEHEHVVVDLLRAGDRVVGVRASSPEGEREIEADLVVACDGTMSPTRELAGLPNEVTLVGEGSLTFMSPAIIDRSFSMRYLSDGGIIGLLGWPQGSAGWRSIDPIGPEAALAPGLEALQRTWVQLMPEAEKAVMALTSMDQVRYSEPRVMTTPTWWTPGVVIIGDAARFFGPETGVSSGLGLGDAHALAEALAQHPDDPDTACASYVTWREPAVRPYEATDPGRQNRPKVVSADRPPAERWPPDE